MAYWGEAMGYDMHDFDSLDGCSNSRLPGACRVRFTR
jgi:hypothetical protein